MDFKLLFPTVSSWENKSDSSTSGVHKGRSSSPHLLQQKQTGLQSIAAAVLSFPIGADKIVALTPLPPGQRGKEQEEEWGRSKGWSKDMAVTMEGNSYLLSGLWKGLEGSPCPVCSHQWVPPSLEPGLLLLQPPLAFWSSRSRIWHSRNREHKILSNSKLYLQTLQKVDARPNLWNGHFFLPCNHQLSLTCSCKWMLNTLFFVQIINKQTQRLLWSSPKSIWGPNIWTSHWWILK